MSEAFANTQWMIPDNKNQVIVYVDGASSGNPGPGGWGAIIATPSESVIEIGGPEAHTTNNRMELTASIRALERIQSQSPGLPVLLYSDSTYVIQGITQWIFAWKKRGWLTADGKNVANSDLWQNLSNASQKLRIEWQHVRGHSGVPGNERADEIAVAYSRGQKPALYEGPIVEYPVSLLPTKAAKIAKKIGGAKVTGLPGLGK